MLAKECPEANVLAPDHNDVAKFIEMLLTRRKRVEEEKDNA
jgi:hypothetical protein